MVDERTNQVYDYRHLGEPEWKGIFDPEHAPNWVLERERLWNAVERREDESTRPDQAQLARDFKIALPTGLNAQRRLALTKDFAEYMAGKGMVADVAIHAPHAPNNENNYHAHMLFTMREVKADGFGNKVRAWNQIAELNRWTEKWSELGAEHLRRAGFKNEAERFEVGHLSRPEQLRRAHARGDMAHFEQLLNEPLRHRGPKASGMQKRGHATRIADINREIEARNRLGGIPRELRAAYALSTDVNAFAKTLEQKNMLLARITKSDVQACVVEFATEGQKYTPMYRENEYVIATEQGTVYRLGRMTTGDSFKGMQKFTKPLDKLEIPSLEAAHVELKKRSLLPNLDREKVIADLMRLPNNLVTTETPARILLEHTLQNLAGGAGNIPIEVRQKLPSTPKIPIEANPHNLRGNAAQIWWAYNSTKTPEAFVASLEERGLRLARVSAEDAQESKTQHWLSKGYGRHTTLLREGDYVAADERGRAYHLTKRFVSHESREVKAFLGALDQKPMPSLREVRAAVHEKQQEQIAATERRGIDPVKGRGSVADSLRRPGSIAKAVLGQPLVFVANAFESLFATSISPEERKLAAVLEQERHAATERAERQRGDYERER